MRTVTFADPKLLELVDKSFIPVWHNQNAQDEVSTSGKLRTTTAQQPVQATVEAYPEGGGGTNMMVLVCDPQGRVLHYVQGYWTAESLIRELNFASEQYALAREAGPERAFQVVNSQLQSRIVALSAEVQALNDPEEANLSVRQSAKKRRQAALGLLMASYGMGQQYVGTQIGPFLDQTRQWNLMKGVIS